MQVRKNTDGLDLTLLISVPPTAVLVKDIE